MKRLLERSASKPPSTTTAFDPPVWGYVVRVSYERGGDGVDRDGCCGGDGVDRCCGGGGGGAAAV